MRNTAARRVALTGMLFALALVLGYFESFLAGVLLLPPGVKLGLSNIVVMYALLFLSRREALLLVVLKAGFAFITRGATAGLLSLSGGMLSLLVMIVLLLPKRTPSLLLLSVLAALAHNLGQLLVVRLYMNAAVLYYAPVLAAAGVGTGILTALFLKALLPAMQKAGLARKDAPQTGR